ncbi:sugar-binding protein [Streptomyces sp. A3M-1-3]|uniref:RHS repeat-associated core domain-containing protein n=1 Tax=Streptomyces sp. A3M-1-3 TaxID=2962044 RepID=UPI0020B87A44|nr:RHS repeat-associated core domain-containing protein [Streptomyces sp. A3M-1-3]MCP3819959.1 sugar-binding protein [Streptomyces sp. A3M-1-3]
MLLALSAGSVQALPAKPGAAKRPGVQDSADPAEGRNATAKARPADPAKKAAVSTLDRAVWPDAGSVELTVSAKKASDRSVQGARGGHGTPGTLPVTVAEAAPASNTNTKAPGTTAADKQGTSPSTVRISALDHRRAEQLGSAALLRVQRTDGVQRSGKVALSVNYSAFAEAYGGDYAARLQLVQLPACATIAVPGSEKCPELPKVLRSANDQAQRTVTAEVEATPDTGGLSTQAGTAAPLVALAAGDSSAKGDYKATPLAPSASWNVANSSGGFSWNYPVRTVLTPGGQTPAIGLNYSSQSVDGRTSVTNNQGSWIGEGFSYEPGYIERSYKACADDGHKTSAEQCWAYDNATILLNGSSTQLIKDDTTGKWHFASESGTKVERLTGATNGDDDGEHWKVTTPDGTEYYFGQNRLPGWATGNEVTNSAWTTPVFGDDSGEPCYNATFTSAHCKQAWRWNLDYVKDTHGNVMSYFYAPETNYYALGGKTDVNGTSYHRGGYLKRIDYGQRDGQVYAAKAPAQVAFTVAERCLPTADFDCAETKRTTANASRWPDTPVDRECKAATKCSTSQAAPTFFTTKRLTGITTRMRTGADTYAAVDAWTFTHLFTDNGDDSKTLWLSKIDHEGRAGGSVKLPTLDLYGKQLPNRVDKDGDNIAPFHRFRLASVLSETGAQVDVNYAPTDCTATALPKAGESTKRCYPVKWAPPGTIDPIEDWFHKYVVAEVVETDRTGGGEDLVTRYNYQGSAGWRHAEPDGITDAKYLTWGGWQGYGKVTLTSGSATNQSTRIDYTYLQGLDGDKLPGGGMRSEKVTDSTGTVYTGHQEYTGFEIESQTYDNGKVIAKSVSEPWKRDTATQTQSWATTKATIVKPETTRGYTLLPDGTWRATKSVSHYDTANATGRLTQTDDFGDLSTTKDDTCTRMWYADNPAKNLLQLPSRSETVSVGCSATPDRRTQVIADERTSYDDGAFGAAPVKGDATSTERLTSHNGTTATYQVTGTTRYDAFGRATSQKNASGTETRTVYTEVNGLISQTKVFNAREHVTTTDYAPAWGQSTGQTDPNGKRTELAYDAMGRLTSVWLADRAKTQTPSIKHSYDVRRDKPVAVKTEKIEIDGSYGVEYQLYDGLLRPRQKQTEGPGGTRMVGDVFYDGTGKPKRTNATYNATGAPSSELLTVNSGEVGAQTAYEYDGLGRTTAEIFQVAGVEQWRTTYVHEGDRVHTDPPQGGVPATAITDARGKTVELRHYKGSAPTVAGTSTGYDATTYTYDTGDRLTSLTDAEGNTWRYEYDQLGRTTKSTDPDAGATTTVYDALDRPVSTTDARNMKTSVVYDVLDRPVTTWEGEPNTGTKLTESRYDKAGWLGQAWASLRYTNGAEYFATATQAMDDFYRPLKTAYSVPAAEGALAGVYTFTTTYNRDGTVQGQGMPAAGGLTSEAIALGYDDLQRPKSMTGQTPYVTDTVYSSTSRLNQLQLSTGSGKKTWQTFFYEKGTDRLTRSVVDVEGVAGPAKASHYSYDQIGNVLSVADTARVGAVDVQCLKYDYQYRMTESWTPAATQTTGAGSGTVGGKQGGSLPSACAAAPGSSPLGGPAAYWNSYTFDKVGNRLTETVHDTGLNATKDVKRTYTYGEGTAGPHAVTKVVENTPTGDSQRTFTYDASGNTTKRTIGGNTQSLEWDATGKPVKVTEANGSTTTNIFDAGGSRVLRRDATATTVYLPGMELRLPKGSSKVEATRYYAYAGQAIAIRTNDNKLAFLASDHHGTSELAIDPATGAVTQRRMDPYGKSRGTATGSWPGEKGFVGGTIDASTGLTQIGARQYDSYLGKFISPDPVVDHNDPQQLNAYAYAHNRPVSSSDPTGLYDPDVQAYCNAHPNSCSGGRIKSGESKDEQAANDAQDKVDQAEKNLAASKQQVKQAAKELVEIAKDILGINAAMDCFSSGDLAACGETALNIAGSFAGGLAGKILAKYGMPWNWAKGIKLAKRVAGLVGDLIGGVKGIWQNSKAVNKARDALATARAKVKKASRGSSVEEMDGAIPAGSPVTHGGSFTRIGDDPKSVRNSQNVANGGEHDVIAHGTPEGYLDLDEGLVNGGQIVDAVRSNANYSGGCIRLMVCHSGTDGPNIAQQVANEMGVTVRAPTNAVGTNPALGPGQVPQIARGGYWRMFLPIVKR